jgi:deoxyhypusine monooxygenase
MASIVTEVNDDTYKTLKASLLNESGKVPLHERYRTLFTLKSLKTERAVEIIAAGEC